MSHPSIVIHSQSDMKNIWKNLLNDSYHIVHHIIKIFAPGTSHHQHYKKCEIHVMLLLTKYINKF